MSRQVGFAPSAQEQLRQIYTYIADAASPDIALGFTTDIVDYCDSLTTFPERGAQRDDLRPGLRLVGFRRRVVIAFTVDEMAITVLGVFYGGQDYDHAFD
ncbi:MAG TPA: type II toxin-antitoxin system RelE/ParE family toxin [Dongiaceae bacterium]